MTLTLFTNNPEERGSMRLLKPLSFTIIISCFLSIFIGCKDDPLSPPSNQNPNPINNDPNVPADVKNWTSDQIDSLFKVFVERVQKIEDITSYSQFRALEIDSIRDKFDHYLVKDSSNTKANIGYIASTLLSLNSSPKVTKLVDSLDKYYSDFDDYNNSQSYSYYTGIPNSSKSGIAKQNVLSDHSLRNAFRKGGIQSLSYHLVTKTPQITLAQTQMPSFPRFITQAYIHETIMEEIMPQLDSVIISAQRLENKGSFFTITVNVNNFAYDIEKQDILILDAGLRLFRGFLGIMTAYDTDLFTSASDQTYSWIDQVNDFDYNLRDTTHYSLSNDTLIEKTQFNNDFIESSKLMAKVLKYNYSRSQFMKIRYNNHAKAYEDLKAIPKLLENALKIAKAQNSTNDVKLLNQNQILNMEESMIDLKREMLNNKIDPSLANKFSNPETFLNFITEILTGPFTYNGILDGKTVNFTIDISKFFTNPVADLKTFLPKFKWVEESQQITTNCSSYSNYDGSIQNSFYFFDYGNSPYKIDIPESYIEKILVDGYRKDIILKPAYSYSHKIEVTCHANFKLLDLVDDQGKVVDIDAPNFFPYFSDYTFNGIFPGMTRTKWINLVW